jgi:predicted ATPase
MFDHINLAGLANSPMFGYAKDVLFFKGKRKVSFKPGLNILVGPNGSGKSTILKMLGESMCAIQGGVSTITEQAVHTGVDMMAPVRSALSKSGERVGMTDKFGLSVAHDGQPVVFCDPRQTVGLIGGGFDDDFFNQGMEEVMTGKRASHGQMSLYRAGLAIGVLMGNAKFPTQIERKIKREHVNEVWQRAIDVLEARLTPSIAKGQPSVLLDEPEANYSVVWQARLWKLIANEAMAKQYQVIVASHSAFAFGIEHANYIETEKGYRQKAESALKERFGS